MRLRDEKEYNIHMTNEERNILDLMYSHAPGYVRTRSSIDKKNYMAKDGEKTMSSFLKACCYKKDFSDKAVNISSHALFNSYLSLATYKSRGDGTEKNIRAVEAIALDVDFTGKYERFLGQSEMVLDILYGRMFESFMDGKYIPYPTFVDMSRHLRFVYVFDKPMYINDDPKKRRHQTTLLKRIAKCLAEAINRLDPDFGASPQPLTSFFRKPDSVNRKYYGGRQEGGKFRYDYKTMFRCRLAWGRYASDPRQEIGHTWGVQELSDIILPPKDGWYDPKFSESDRALRKAVNSDIGVLMDDRIGRIKKHARMGDCDGCREKMLFHLANCLLTKGEAWSVVAREAEALNRGFPHPLTPSGLKSAISVREPYRYTEEQFAMETGCPPVKATETKAYKAKKSAGSRDRYVAKRSGLVAEGGTKMQERAERIRRVQEMHENGMSRSEIAHEAGLSYGTVRNYLTGRVKAKDAGEELEKLKGSEIRHFSRKAESKAIALKKTPDYVNIMHEPYVDAESRDSVADAFKNADGERVVDFIVHKWGALRYNYDIAVPEAEGITDYEEALTWKAGHDAEIVRARHEKKRLAARMKHAAKKTADCKKIPPLYVSPSGPEREKEALTALPGKRGTFIPGHSVNAAGAENTGRLKCHLLS